MSITNPALVQMILTYLDYERDYHSTIRESPALPRYLINLTYAVTLTTPSHMLLFVVRLQFVVIKAWPFFDV